MNIMNYEYFMEKALVLAENALSQGEFPVGCVIVYNDEVIVDGFREGTADGGDNEIDHAEIVALRHLYELDLNIDDKNKISIFSTLEPCLMCYGAILLSGIGEIVYAYEDVMGGGTGCNLKVLSPLYAEHQITIMPNTLRDKSLRIFKYFFSTPDNNYWRGSLLEKYTLGQ